VNSREVTLLVWSTLGVIVLGVEVLAAASKNRVPGAGAVISRLAERPSARVALVLFWMWLGWHAFAR
jgi:hypothetical protein